MKAPTKLYLTNKELLAEVIESKAAGRMSNKLGAMFLKLVHKYGTKNNFSGYTYLEEMQGRALEGLCRNWQSFDTEKYTNAFAYYTSCIHNEFLQEMRNQKKQQDVKNLLLMNEGYNPSFSFQDRYDEEREMVIEEPVPVEVTE